MHAIRAYTTERTMVHVGVEFYDNIDVYNDLSYDFNTIEFLTDFKRGL